MENPELYVKAFTPMSKKEEEEYNVMLQKVLVKMKLIRKERERMTKVASRAAAKSLLNF